MPSLPSAAGAAAPPARGVWHSRRNVPPGRPEWECARLLAVHLPTGAMEPPPWGSYLCPCGHTIDAHVPAGCSYTKCDCKAPVQDLAYEAGRADECVFMCESKVREAATGRWLTDAELAARDRAAGRGGDAADA